MTTLPPAAVPATVADESDRRLPEAVLWDMDGTLVDTEPYWMRAEGELVGRFGGVWTHDDGLTLVGSGLWVSAGVIQSRGVDLTTDEIGVPWRPGALELLKEIRDRGIPTALVTMSVKRMAQQVVDKIPFSAFDLLVTGDTVEHPKPHPEAYLTAARELGVDPSGTVAIEDSLAGLAAAIAAGTIAVGVPHMVPLPESAEHTVWKSLVGRGVEDLSDLLAHGATT